MSLDFSLSMAVNTGGKELHHVALYSGNMTHNVRKMWVEAGCHDDLYDSEGKLAGDVLPALEAAAASMETSPEVYKRMDTPSGWGTYIDALDFLKEVRDACERHPLAVIHISK